MPSGFRLCLGLVAALVLAGCGKDSHDHNENPKSRHVHVAPHGGALAEVGEHAYNLELLRDTATGKLTIWVLDGHAENFVRLKVPALEVVATVGVEKRPLTLKAVANSATGETVGDTSQFEAQADWLKSTSAFELAVTNLEIRGTKFEKISFTFAPAKP